MPNKKSRVPPLLFSFLSVSIVWVVQAADQPKVADVLILKGSPIGAVKFMHKVHSETHSAHKCETCHHASKPEKPASSPQQACRDCHTKPLPPGMKTTTQAAFHNPMAKAGTCIDCHVKSNAAGKAAPVACGKCHVRETDTLTVVDIELDPKRFQGKRVRVVGYLWGVSSERWTFRLEEGHAYIPVDFSELPPGEKRRVLTAPLASRVTVTGRMCSPIGVLLCAESMEWGR